MMNTLRAEPAPPYRIELTILLIWAAVYLVGLYFHEPWSDEVRAYSLMREGGDPVGIFFGLRNEGHPVLWYWWLWVVDQLVDHPLTLKVAASIVAFATTAMVMCRMPLPLYLRVAIILSVVGLHEIQIIARNYGIAFLILLCIIDTALRHPDRHWLLLPLLVLFANTNAYATVMTPWIALALLWPHVWAVLLRFERRSIMLLAIYGIALALAALAAWYAGSQDELTAVRPYEVDGQTGRTLEQIIWDLRGAFGYTSIFEFGILPQKAEEIIKKAMVLFMLLSLAFSVRYFTAGALALGLWIVLSGLLYRGQDRHALMLVITLFALFVLMFRTEGLEYRGWRARLIPVAVGFWTLCFVGLNDLSDLARDIRLPFTGAAGAAERITADGGTGTVIVLSDSGYHVEAMPYYLLKMKLYQVREGRFRAYTRLTRESSSGLSIAEIIEAAKRLKVENPGANVYFVTDVPYHLRQGSGRQDLYFKWYTDWDEESITSLNSDFLLLGRDEAIQFFEGLYTYKLK
ncbi:MAG: hypothetical protein AAFQ75_00430 [Pseudomonadota bacterium]